MLDKIQKTKKLIKFHHSYSMLIDKKLLDNINADPDCEFDIFAENGQIIIKPKELIEKKSDKNRDFGLDICTINMDDDSFKAFKRKLQQLLVAYKAEYKIRNYEESKGSS